MSIDEFAEYIKYLSDELLKEQKERQEEQLFQIWLHKVWDKDFLPWKKEILGKANKKIEKKERMTKEEEEENINKAEKILGR